jgi:hypothetical protein
MTLNFKDAFHGQIPFDVRSVSIWQWRMPVGSALWTFFIAQASNREVLAGTDVEYLKATLARGQEGPDRDSSTGALARSQYVDRGAPVWAVRRFFDRVDDRSAAGLRLREGIEVGKSAVALTLSVARRSPVATVRYVAKGSPDGPVRMWKEDGVAVKEVARGVWEASLPLSESQKDVGEILVVLQMLGYVLSL